MQSSAVPPAIESTLPFSLDDLVISHNLSGKIPEILNTKIFPLISINNNFIGDIDKLTGIARSRAEINFTKKLLTFMLFLQKLADDLYQGQFSGFADRLKTNIFDTPAKDIPLVKATLKKKPNWTLDFEITNPREESEKKIIVNLLDMKKLSALLADYSPGNIEKSREIFTGIYLDALYSYRLLEQMIQAAEQELVIIEQLEILVTQTKKKNTTNHGKTNKIFLTNFKNFFLMERITQMFVDLGASEKDGLKEKDIYTRLQTIIMFLQNFIDETAKSIIEARNLNNDWKPHPNKVDLLKVTLGADTWDKNKVKIFFHPTNVTERENRNMLLNYLNLEYLENILNIIFLSPTITFATFKTISTDIEITLFNLDILIKQIPDPVSKPFCKQQQENTTDKKANSASNPNNMFNAPKTRADTVIYIEELKAALRSLKG